MTTPPRDLVFFGSGAFGIPSLAHLAARDRVHAVVTQPDRPAGRGGKLTPTPIASWCAEHAPGIPVLKPARVSVPDVAAEVRAFPSSAWVVIAFGQKLSASLLEGRFAINLHASILPRWRGAAPIHAAVLAGDREIGNSVITLADKMDAGLVLASSRRPRDPMRTSGELHDLLAEGGPGLIDEVLDRHAAGTLKPVVQDESLVTLAPKLSREDAWINFRDPAEAGQRRVHGLNPWPGVAVRFRESELKLLRVETLVLAHGAAAGTLVDPKAGVVACGSSTALRLVEVQPAGKRAMTWSAFAAGSRPLAGERLVGEEGAG